MQAITREISENFSSGNFAFAYPHFDEDIEWNVVGTPVMKGKEAVIAYCDRMLQEMENSTLNNTHYIVGDDSIAVQGHCNYTTPENVPGKVAYCDVYRFKDEKLLEITSYCIELKL